MKTSNLRVPISFLTVLAAIQITASPSQAVEQGCNQTFGPTLNRELSDFLKNPKKSPAALLLGQKICNASISSDTPCPLSVGGERVGQISNASKKIGAAIVPIAVCLSQHVSGALQEDFHDLLSDLLDRLGPSFIKGYYSLGEQALKGAAPLDSFVTFVSDSSDNSARRVKVLEKRLLMLQGVVQASAQDQIEAAKTAVQSTLQDAKRDLGIEKQSSLQGDYVFKASKFDDEISQRLIRFKVNDVIGMAEVAEKLRQNFGLTYNVILKSEQPNNLSLCGSSGSCKSVSVNLGTQKTACNEKSSQLAVRKTLNEQWSIITNQNTVYQLNPKSNFTSVGVNVELRESSGNVINRWVMPQRTYRIYALSSDLRKAYFLRVIKSPSGTKLGDLFLEVADTGSSQFVGLRKEDQQGNPNPDKYVFLNPVDGEQSLPPQGDVQYKINVELPCRP